MKTLEEALDAMIYQLNKGEKGSGTGYAVGDGTQSTGEKFKAELLTIIDTYRPGPDLMELIASAVRDARADARDIRA